MRRFFRNNGLTIVWLGMFFVTFIFGQVIFGLKEFNSDQRDHGQKEISLSEYLVTGHFVEATMENWESEFLQMFLFIVLTSFLYQKGSAESKKLDKKETVDKKPQKSSNNKSAPWPVRKGGVVLFIYQYSLSLCFLLLFLLSFLLHAAGGAREYNQDQQAHGHTEQVSTFGYMATSRFWFESFQNWQSEFLSVGLMVLLTIWLRQKGSPESKPVDAPHSQTGKD
jgi:hypothetical protein